MNFSCLLHTAETPIIIITATSSSHSLAAFQFTSSLVFLIFWESFLNWFHFHLLVQLCWLCSYFWWIFCYAAHFFLWNTSIYVWTFFVSIWFHSEQPMFTSCSDGICHLYFMFHPWSVTKVSSWLCRHHQFVSSCVFEVSHNKQKC